MKCRRVSEYTALLLDQFLSDRVLGRILTVGRNTLPEGPFRYLNDMPKNPGIDVATKQLERYTLLPKVLMKERDAIGSALREIVSKRLIRYYHEAQSINVYDLFFTQNVVGWAKNRMKAKWGQRNELVKRALRSVGVGDYKTTRFTPEIARLIRGAIEAELVKSQASEFKKDGDFINHIEKLKELEKESGGVLCRRCDNG
jgi:uncharacterized protein